MKNDHGPRLWSRKTNINAAAVLMIEDRPGRNGLKNALPIGGAFLSRVITPEKISYRAGARVFTVQDRRDMLQDIRGGVSVYRAACRALSRVLYRIPARRYLFRMLQDTGPARSVMQDQDRDRDRIPGAACVFPGPVPGYLLPIGACFNPGPLQHTGTACGARMFITAAGPRHGGRPARDPGRDYSRAEKVTKRPSKTFVKTFLKNS